MRRRAIPLVVAAGWAALLLAAGPVAQVHACSCSESTPQQQLASADGAFVGVVGRIDEVPVGEGKGAVETGSSYTIVVEEALKGGWKAGDAVRVDSELGTCGVQMSVGQRWRVLSNLQGSRYVTSICSGNELLAEGVPVPAATPVPEQPAGPPPAAVLIAAGALAVVGAASTWAFTRRGRHPSA